jgi:hypothetical protein
MTPSFSFRLDPVGTKKLINGRKSNSYRANTYISNIPGVWCTAYTLRCLANLFTAQFSSELETFGTGSPHTEITIVSKPPKAIKSAVEYEAPLTDTLVAASLLGVRFLHVQSYDVQEEKLTTTYKKTDDPTPIRYRSIRTGKAKHQVLVVAVEFSPLNATTGEMYENSNIPLLFSWLEQKHLLYSIADDKCCLLTLLPSPSEYPKAIDYLKQLSAKVMETTGILIDGEKSSLFVPFPLPLTITKQGHYCEILNVSAVDSDARIQEFLEHRKHRIKEQTTIPPPQERDENTPATEEPAQTKPPEDHDIQWYVSDDYVVCKSFYDGVTKLIQDKAAPENTTPKKLIETRKLLGYFLFSKNKDRTGNLILSSEAICQAIHGTKKKVRGNNFNLSAMLHLLDPIASLQISKPSYRNNLATTLKSIRFTEEFNVLWTEECQKLRKELVWLSNGKNTLKHQAAILQYQRENATNSTTLYPCDIALDLMDELNKQKPNIYTKIYNSGISRALLMAEALDRNSKNTNKSTLDKIRLQPIPIYHRTEKTNRLAQSGGFFSLSREIRNSFFSGYFMADIKHSQLSINSFLWECEEMQEKLKGGDVWNYLCQSSGLTKDEAKAGLMLLMYEINSKIPQDSPYIKLFNVPEIKALKESKQAYIKRILSDGYVFDAFGNRVEINDGNVSSRVPSISQGYEFLLLQDIFRHYIDHHEKDSNTTFQILLYGIDGFFYSCDRRYEERVEKFISSKFQQKASELGIYTSLEILQLP